jgi:hypothetical protein
VEIGGWEIPGGPIGEGETAADAALRETLAATGYGFGATDGEIITDEIDGAPVTTFFRRVDVEFSPTLDQRYSGYAWLSPADALADSMLAGDDFKEADHPRGQPDNAGQFGPGGGGGGKAAAKSAPAAVSHPYRAGLKAHGAEWAAERKELWRKSAPSDVHDLIARSPKNQAELAEVASKAAADLGIPFKDPGVKSTEGIHRKIADGKSVQQINDAVRAGFDTPTPEASDRIVRALARKFEVADEGWTVTPAGYFDRKLMVRFEDGQIGEVQMWAPGMLDAKEGSGGGHKLYEKFRESKDPGERYELTQQMNALYAGVQEKLDPTWKTIFRPNQP